MNGDDRARLTRLLGMTGSSHDGEALNALRFAQKLMKQSKITWEDTLHGNGMLAHREGFQEGHQRGFEEGYAKGFREGKHAPRARPGSWQVLAFEMLRDHHDELSEWETGFLTTFKNRKWHTPSEKQRCVFEHIASRLGLEVPD